MNFDTDLTNRHVFSEGNIQLSPHELRHLNAQPPQPFKASYIKTAADSGYRVFLSGYANKILQNELKLKYGRFLETSINSLRANTRPASGYIKKNTVDTRILESQFHFIWYRIHNGQILVYNIELKDSIQLERDRQEKVAVYTVAKNAQGVWTLGKKSGTVTTAYAAVNGQSNNLAKAAWLMGAHLEFEFGKTAVREYTLFHNPSTGGPGDTWESIRDKFGITTDVTKKFSALLQQAQQAGNKTKWIAHSQGGLIFAEAVRYHLNGNSSWAITGGFNGMFRDDKGESLNKHSVAFHGNANNNLRSSVLFERAGIDVIATRANDYDFVNTIVGLNTANPWRILGSAMYANHVFSGSVQQSPHTLMHEDRESWNEQMDNGPGRGRNGLQKGFNTVDETARKGIRYINNYLK